MSHARLNRAVELAAKIAATRRKIAALETELAELLPPPERESIAAAVLRIAAARDTIRAREVAEELRVAVPTVRTELARHAKSGRLLRVRDGVYRSPVAAALLTGRTE